MKHKMSEIIQASRPRIIEAVLIRHKHLQPFIKSHIQNAAWSALEATLKIVRDCEAETEKKQSEQREMKCNT